MSKKAMLGGAIIALLLLMGLFGEVSMNDKPIESRLVATLVAAVLFPAIIILIGIVTGFLKDALLSFLKEVTAKVKKKVGGNEVDEENPTT